jgi:hypothetical protein
MVIGDDGGETLNIDRNQKGNIFKVSDAWYDVQGREGRRRKKGWVSNLLLCTYLISKNHKSPIGFTTENTPYTLSGVPHSVKAKPFRFTDPISVPEVF